MRKNDQKPRIKKMKSFEGIMKVIAMYKLYSITENIGQHMDLLIKSLCQRPNSDIMWLIRI